MMVPTCCPINSVKAPNETESIDTKHENYPPDLILALSTNSLLRDGTLVPLH